jgi:hypothetical protein
MRARGQDTADAIRDWTKDEIKKGPSDLYDLGKFFFTVSSGSAGLVGTVAKLDTSFQIGPSIAVALLLYVASILIALDMVRPQITAINGATDLLGLYEKRLRRGIHRVWIWFSLWILADAVSVYALFHNEVKSPISLEL